MLFVAVIFSSAASTAVFAAATFSASLWGSCSIVRLMGTLAVSFPHSSFTVPVMLPLPSGVASVLFQPSNFAVTPVPVRALFTAVSISLSVMLFVAVILFNAAVTFVFAASNFCSSVNSPTVTVQVAVSPPSTVVAVITAVPFLRAITLPPSTSTISELLDDHSTF